MISWDLPLAMETVGQDVRELRRRIYPDQLGLTTSEMYDLYLSGANIVGVTGVTYKLIYDPSRGDDIQSMVYWAANQSVPQGSTVVVEVSLGMHDVTTILQITDNRAVFLTGPGVTTLNVTGATFSLISGNQYTATVTVATPIPSYVTENYPVGGQNIQGDGSADCLNTGMIVKAVASDRLSFTTDLNINGPVPLPFTTPDATVSLGLTPNLLVIPQAALRVNQLGWNGAAQDEEGFITCLSGGRVDLQDLGISFNGVEGPHDILFARDAGSEVYMRDNVVLAGTGAMCTRSFAHGSILGYKAFIGGGLTGDRVWQGSGGATSNFTRSMLGSVKDEIISGSSGAYSWVANSCMSGANFGARTTYESARIDVQATRLSHCNVALGSTLGTIGLGAGSIRLCNTPVQLAGGVVSGDTTFSDNVNSLVEHNKETSNGGFWRRYKEPINTAVQLVGIYTGVLDFPSIPSDNVATLTLSAPGVQKNDFVFVQKNNADWPTQPVDYEAGSDTDTITVRAKNFGSAAVDPVAITLRTAVLRMG